MNQHPATQGLRPRHRAAVPPGPSDRFGPPDRFGRFGPAYRWGATILVMILMATFAAVLGAPRAGAASETVVSLTFDDGNADQLEAVRILDSHGLDGTFFVVSGLVGAPNYLTLPQLQEMVANGHEIGGHTVTHPDLAQVSDDEVRRQVCNDRANLTGWGFKVTSFAYPFASITSEARQIVAGCGYNSARGLGDIASRFAEVQGLDVAETVPPANAFETRALDQVQNTWTLQDLKDVVTNAETTGGWLQLTFHNVDNNGGPISVAPAVLNEFAGWLAARSAQGTTVRTVDAVIGGAVKPAVTGPAVQPGPVNGNLIQNPGLEEAGPDLPRCWQIGQWGVNQPTFSPTSPGRTGTVAQQLLMESYASGDAKLLPMLDLGGCSPAVSAGNTYSLRAWYKSSGATQFEIYYRTAQGGWTYWTSSPFFAAAADWSQAEFTTPGIPAGATGLSFGLNLVSNGTLVTDDYELYNSAGAPPLGDTAPPPVNPPVDPGPPTEPPIDPTPPDPPVDPTPTGPPVEPPVEPEPPAEPEPEPEPEPPASYPDVPSGSMFFSGIMWLAQQRITTGFEDGTFRPTQPVNRDAMAAFMYRFAGSPAFTPPAASPFRDVATSNQFYKEITWLAQQGITTGFGDGTFRPTQPVNRGAMAAFMYRFAGSPPFTVPAASPFRDTATSHPFYQEITWLSARGIATGWPDGTFRYLQPVNRDAMAAFMFRFNQAFPRN